MIGQRSSLLFTIATNPLIWIGAFLGFLHLSTNTNSDIWEIFHTEQTYVYLIIGASIYTALFDKHYTKNRERIAIPETMLAILTNAYIILFVWGTVVFAVSEYHQSGLEYSLALRERMAEEKAARQSETISSAAPITNLLTLDSNKRYKLTPTNDGSYIIEVLDN